MQASMTVLVVVADPVLRVGIRGLLSQRGFTVHDRATLDSALEILSNTHLDIVFAEDTIATPLDPNLQRTTAPLVLIGPPDPQHILELLQAEVADYLPTPLDSSNLDLVLARVRNLVLSCNQAVAQAYSQGALDERERLLAQVQSESLALMSRLAANLTHEINNPLTPIAGLAELLYDEAPLDSQQRAMTLTIINSARRIATTVRSLLGYTYPISRRDPADLRILVNETLQGMRQRLAEQRITLGVHLPEVPVLLPVSISELKQALFVVFDHARQTMPQGGMLTVRLHASDGSNEVGQVKVEVTDTAMPIGPHHLPHLFEPFYAHAVPGISSGLGLAIARRIVEAHGGRISVSSNAPHGNTFTVILPEPRGNVNAA